MENDNIHEGKLNIPDELVEQMEDADLRDIEEDDNDLYDNSDVVFTEHEGSVFVVSVDPKYGKYAVSGGEDDKAFVWEIITGKVVFECTGYKDSVTCACFNADSTLVAVGDMAGNVKVWKLETKQVIWSFETSDLEWLMWHPVAPVLLAGTQDGESWMWKIPSGDLKTFHSPGSSCTCGVFLPDGKSASFGYADGSVKIIELKSGDIKCSTSKGKNSKQEGINHIACDKEGNVLMTASIDGTSKLISTSTGKISVTYRVTEEKSDEEGESSVECVGFSSSLPLAASASLNNKLTIWDLKSGQARHKCLHPAGVSVMKWNKAGTSIYTACLDGIGRLWNARSGELENTFVGHSDEIYDIALTTDDKCFLSASADGSVRVYCMEDK